MKSILTGVIMSAIICGLGYFLFVPKVKEQSYQEGYSKGLTEGSAKGLLEGTAAGKEMQQKYDDSLRTALATAKRDSLQRIPKPPAPKKEHVNYNINYRVIGNQIAEPTGTSSPASSDTE